MGLLDIFKAGEIKRTNEALTQEVARMRDAMSPEQAAVADLSGKIAALNAQKELLDREVADRNVTVNSLDKDIANKRKQLLDLDDELLYQEFSLYKPRYDFASAAEYKEKLDKIRDKQKEEIKAHRGVVGGDNWAVNNSQKQGEKMVNDMKKLLLRAFNCECDDIIRRVTYANVELSEKRIQTTADQLTKLGTIMHISLTPFYVKLKIQELHLAHEYQVAKQKEKEEQKELRAKLREEAKVQKELEEARQMAEKELRIYQKSLSDVYKQLETEKNEERRKALEERKEEYEAHLVTINKNIEDINYRETNIKVGKVYIISNIGAFGENVYKIGMTRREDPYERVDELGDASVPFNFDVHAMIHTSDAPALEATLHKAFADRRINMVNHRREFFNVTLDEIKEVVLSIDKTVEFKDIPDAADYRKSQKMRGF